MASRADSAPLDVDSPVTRVVSVGARSAQRLGRLGIATVRQLLWHLPSRYEDYSAARPISEIIVGEKQSVQGEVVSIGNRFIWPKRLTITTATIKDESGGVRAVWFNQPYLEEALAVGTQVSLAGKAVLDKRGLYLANPAYEKIGGLPGDQSDLRHTGRMVPVYPETTGVTSRYLRFLIQPLLEKLEIVDPLPATIRTANALVDLAVALRTVHYPDGTSDMESARKRLAFDDILVLQLKALQERRLLNLQKSAAVPLDSSLMKTMVSGLPFILTRDQRVATLEILRDMERSYPMNRLLEGDVGSGKTVVALLAALHAARKGLQTVLLAPTELLAHQHYATLRMLTKKLGGPTSVFISSSLARVDDTETAKTRAKQIISRIPAAIIIGTHALLEGDVKFKQLALVVVDEQHRFGISQRAALVKADRHASGQVPHLLSMTATPIPRTLALTIFGDLDISLLREKPAGRQTIITRVVKTVGRPDMYDAIRAQVRAGRQVFVICPMIETQKAVTTGKPLSQTKMIWSQAKAVQDEHARLSTEVFPDLKVGMLHGRMKPKEKEQIMREFRDGWQDILVATSVIEVGVDVPNATVMLIEGADRFGLAQLHQFRGRVGRGTDQSYCFLCATDDGGGYKRLSALTKTDDGFVLAEADMKIRGPGEFFGLKQSGMPDMVMAALADVELIKAARTAARAIMKSDPTLKRNPLLASLVAHRGTMVHTE